MELQKRKNVDRSKWLDFLLLRKSFDFYVELDIETCASNITHILKRSGKLGIHKQFMVRIKPLPPSYKFKIDLPEMSSKALGVEAYLTGQLYPVPNMTGTQVIGTAYPGMALPIGGTLVFIICLLIASFSESALDWERNATHFIGFFILFMTWATVIFFQPQNDFAKKFEAYLKAVETKSFETEKKVMKAKRDAQQNEHPSKSHRRH